MAFYIAEEDCSAGMLEDQIIFRQFHSTAVRRYSLSYDNQKSHNEPSQLKWLSDEVPGVSRDKTRP
jgi:hypothetical protein